jgi:mandelamide amidase
MKKLMVFLVFGAMCLSPMHAASQSATETAERIKAGKITSEALVRELLGRAKKNSDLNTFISLDEAIAIADAKKADQDVKSGKKLGKLHGVPFVIKDNIDVKGFVTTARTPVLVKHYPNGDAKIVAKLRSKGAVIMDKTNLHELAFGVTSNNGYFGAVKNPYNKENFAGESSGGTAAAVAARLAVIGLGTDTGGSIRIPASLNGLYGC